MEWSIQEPGQPPVQRSFEDFFGFGHQPPVPQEASGSGFIVSADGYILTNNHVVQGFDRVEVTLTDRRTFPARVIGRDETTDVAVLKIDDRNLPTLSFGNSRDMRVGPVMPPRLCCERMGSGWAPNNEWSRRACRLVQSSAIDARLIRSV